MMDIQARVFYPLTALVTVNTRMSLLSRKVIFPAVIVSFPLLLVLVFRLVFAIWGPPSSNPEDQDPYNMYSVLCVSLYLQFVVPLIALLKGMTTFYEEIEEGTLMFLRLRPVPRVVIITGKFLAYVVTVSLLLILSLWGSYAILSSIPGSDMFWGDLKILIKDTWILCLGLAAYGAVMMLVGTYFKRSILVGIFLLFVWDAWAAYIPGSAHKFTIKHYLQSIFPHQRESTGVQGVIDTLLSQNTPSTFAVSVSMLLLIVAGCIALTTLAFQFKELSGGPEGD
ncbi:MAG TPA: ABC transporter permease [bacterium]|nr:ABC transporter permease [bacterium]